MIKAIALDDEPLALTVIENFCSNSPDIFLEKTFTSQSEAQKYLRKYPVDLLFLDIQMPRNNGLNFYKNLDHNVAVIFTTAYSDYAVEGFNLDAVDYLVKPFSFERFEESIRKAMLRSTVLANSNKLEFISVRSNYKLNKVLLEDILFIQALDNYIILALKSGQKLTAQMPMKEFLLKLPESRFIRIHRSYIINLTYAETINQKTVQVNGIDLPVGEKYKEDLRKLF